MGADEMNLPVATLQSREITLTGTFRYANTWPTAVATGRVRGGRPRPSGHGHVGLDDVVGALAPGPSAGHIKIVVTPDR